MSRLRSFGLLATRLTICVVAGAVAVAFPALRPSVSAQAPGPPTGYYEDAIGLAGEALRAELHNIIYPHTRLAYGGAGASGLRAVLEEAHQHPDDPGLILTIYRNRAYRKVDDRAEWDREHGWPKSYGFPDESACNLAYSDAHHLFAADDSYNSSRGNKVFDDCEAPCTLRPVDGFPDQPNRYDVNSWEVWLGARGDLARAIMYMDVRYEGELETATSSCPTPEPQLILTDDQKLIEETTGSISPAYMGLKTTLLRWHYQDPVSGGERKRNEVVATYQRNRNPFIDHPLFACALYGGKAGCPPIFFPYVTNGEVLRTLTPSPTPPSTPTPTNTVPATAEPATATPAGSITPGTAVPGTRTPGTPEPSPGPSETMGTPGTPSTPSTPDPPPTSSPTPTETPTTPPTSTPAPGPRLMALRCDTRDEMVEIAHFGSAPLELEGWTLFSANGPNLFVFPAYTLTPGESVFVHSGPDAPETEGAHIRWTTGYIWNDGDDEARLFSPENFVFDIRVCD